MSIAIPILMLSRRGDVADALHGDPGAIRYAMTTIGPGEVDLAAVGRFSAVILDLPSMDDGLSLARKLRRARPSLEILAIVGDERHGVDALRNGALDFLAWPPREPADLWLAVAALTEKVGPPRRDAAGSVAGYRLLRRLGSGGMADVFLAQRPGEEALVVKCMRPEIAEETEYVGMFIEEARVSRVLLHPNIVRVHAAGGTASELYIAMEYVSGKNLSEIMKAVRGRFPERIACWIAAEVAAALDYAHRCVDGEGRLVSLIHRDVNPPNVLIRDDGAVKLTDFGIAKTSQHHTRTTQGVLRGKLEYLSPEQVEGLPLDARTDIFSLGSLLYFLLTGVHPFQATTTLGTLQRIGAARCEPPSVEAPGLPAELDAVVMRALARDRDERYPTAGQFEKDLRAWLTSAGGASKTDVAEFVADAISAGARGVVPRAAGEAVTVGRPGTVTVLSPPRLELASAEGESESTDLTVPSAMSPAPSPAPEATPVVLPEETSSSEIETSEPTVEFEGATASGTAIRPAPLRERHDRIPAWVGGVAAVALIGFFALGGRSTRDLEPASPTPRVVTATPDRVTPPRVSASPAPVTPRVASASPAPVTSPRVVSASPAPVTTPRVALATPARMAPLRKGTVSIWVAEGWAAVTVDGRSLGINAPIVGLELPEGKHRITLENEPLRLRRDYDVTVVAGEDIRLNASLR